MKLIDGDKILEALGAFSDETHGDPHFLAAIASAREIVERMPEAVVRCENCRWHYYRENDIVCANRGEVMQKDDYCSYGERQTDEID